MIIARVPKEYVGQVWPQIKHHIEAACRLEWAELSADDIGVLLELSDAWALVVMEGGAAAMVLKGDAIHIQAMGGDALPSGWEDSLQNWLVEAGKETGKHKATLEGRPGWARKLKRLGWVVTEPNCLEVELWPDALAGRRSTKELSTIKGMETSISKRSAGNTKHIG